MQSKCDAIGLMFSSRGGIALTDESGKRYVLKQKVAIIDFGTGKITALIGSRGINNTINLDGIGVCDYAGYVGGKWIEPEGLASAVANAVSATGVGVGNRIDKLYVGVPGDFLRCDVNEVTSTFAKKRRVTETDLDDLNAQGNLYFNDEEYTVINIQPIYYKLDDDGKLAAPIGLYATRISGCLSYVSAKKDFIALVDAAVKSVGIAETEFVAAPLAEMLYLFDEYKRDNFAMLADVGAYGTTLSIGRGDGLCRVYNFPWGGENITAALADGLEIEPAEAERLKHKVALTLDAGYMPEDDGADGDDIHVMQTQYIVEYKTERHMYPIAMVNSIVAGEIDRFCKYVQKVFKICDYEYPEFLTLSITGGGLVKIRGAIEYVKEQLGREVEQKKPTQPLLDKPQLSSALGTMDMVLNGETPYVGFFGKIKRLFTRR